MSLARWSIAAIVGWLLLQIRDYAAVASIVEESDEALLKASETTITTTTVPTTTTYRYTLRYDGLVNPGLILDQGSGAEVESAVPVLPTARLERLATEIASDIIQLYYMKTKTGASLPSLSQETLIDLDRRCYVVEQGSRCTFDHNQVEQNFSFHSSFYFYRQNEHVLVSADASVTAMSRMLAQDILSDAVPKMNSQLQMIEEPAWSIQHRPSFLEVQEIRQALKPNSVVQTQQDNELCKASLENFILSKTEPEISHRHRVDTNVKLSSSIMDGHDVQVWEYQKVGYAHPIRSLFVNGYLRATTGMAEGTTAHAEAMVHPAMVAHGSPKRIALWSDLPQPLLQEILKHKSVEHVSVLGTTNASSLTQVINQYMPELNNCSFRPGSPLGDSTAAVQYCTDDVAVAMELDDSAAKWVDHLLASAPTIPFTEEEYYNGTATKSSEHCKMQSHVMQPQCHFSRYPQFDIVFIDVPLDDATGDWLNVELHKKLFQLLTFESIVIINVGSAPAMIDMPLDDSSPRDILLRQNARTADSGGLNYMLTLIYEEPLASPLSTTNIVCFPWESVSYDRFVQKHNPASLELDLISKIYPAMSDMESNNKDVGYTNSIRNTRIYDGPTHVAYLHTPLTWENWYCHSPMGYNTYACSSFFNEWFNASYHHFSTEVRRIPQKGRGLFATEMIPQGHFILSHDNALNLPVDSVRFHALEQFVKDFPDADMYRNLYDIFIVYGYESEPMGMTGWGVSIACNATFMNHGCSDEEINADWVRPYYHNEDGDFAEFSPLITRRVEVVAVLHHATRDIPAGQEIHCDYHTFRSWEDDTEMHAFLEKMCKEGIGLVTPVVTDHDNDDNDDDMDAFLKELDDIEEKQVPDL